MTRSIVPDLSTLEVWFLTGSQNLYGDETLRQVAEQSQQVVAGLQAAASLPVSIVWKPTLVDSASIKKVMQEANAAENVIGVIAWIVSLQEPVTVPMVIWHTVLILVLLFAYEVIQRTMGKPVVAKAAAAPAPAAPVAPAAKPVAKKTTAAKPAAKNTVSKPAAKPAAKKAPAKKPVAKKPAAKKS